MELIPLILIPTLFLFVTVMKRRLPAALQPAACAICIAVASTWVLLLAMYPFPPSLFDFTQSFGRAGGQRVPIELIAILIGMSIVGVTFKLEPFYKSRRIENYAFVRLAIIVGGLYTAFFALNGRLSEALVAALAGLFAVILATFFFQNETEPSSARRHLDNCC